MDQEIVDQNTKWFEQTRLTTIVIHEKACFMVEILVKFETILLSLKPLYTLLPTIAFYWIVKVKVDRNKNLLGILLSYDKMLSNKSMLNNESIGSYTCHIMLLMLDY